MRKGKLLLAAAVAAVWAACAQAQGKPTLEQDAIAFGAREAAFDADLSPDGKHAVFVGSGPGRSTVVHVADLSTGTTKPVLYTDGNPDTLRSCSFVSDARLVCRLTAVVTSAGGYAPVGVPIPGSRTLSLDINGKDIKTLGQPASDYDLGIRQFDGEILGRVPGEENSVLMTRLFLPEGTRDNPSNIQRSKSGVGVVKLNVQTLTATTLEPPRESVSDWMSDEAGRVRLLGIGEVSGETYDTGRIKYLYRTPKSREWRPLAGYTDLRDFQPLGIDGSINSLYAVRLYEGSFALTRISLDGDLTETIVAHDPHFNVDRVARIGVDPRVVGYSYKEDETHTLYTDPEYKALSIAIRSALPNHPAVKFVSETRNRNKVLLFAGQADDPGHYYLFDKTKKSLGELVPVRPDLTRRSLAKVHSTSYAVADGATISAEITLPAVKIAKDLPTIVFVGDTGSRDTKGFDWLAQFLAAQGYAVIEPRFRGFNGGDQWFYANGFGGWQTSVGDISASAKYLVGQGIADPNRMAIIGWRNGGYDALLSAEVEPSLFKAIVAIDPITDLTTYKADWYDYTAGKRIAKLVGNAELSGSPIRRASAIRAQVLLAHGTLDAGVRITQSREMRDALRQAGIQSELVEFAGLDGEIADSTARASLLLKIGQLLDRTIGH